MSQCSKLAGGDKRTLEICQEMSGRGYLKKELPSTRHDLYKLAFETANSDYYFHTSNGKNPFNEPSSFVSFLSRKGITPKWFFARDDLINTFKGMVDNERCSNDRPKNLDCVKYVIISLLVYLSKAGIVKDGKAKPNDIPEYLVDELAQKNGARCTELSRFLYGGFLIATGMALSVYEEINSSGPVDHSLVGYPLPEKQLLYIEPFHKDIDIGFYVGDPEEYKDRHKLDIVDFYVESEVQFIELPQEPTSEEEKLASLQKLLAFEPSSYWLYDIIGATLQNLGRDCEAIDYLEKAYDLSHAEKILPRIETAIKFCRIDVLKNKGNLIFQ